MEGIYAGYSLDKVLDDLGEYAIYLRKSRSDLEAESRGEGETLARHEHILLDLAFKLRIKIGKIYREIVSGETIEDRPEMQNLLKDVKMQKWKGILVVEVERLARGETIDQGVVARAFKFSNTKIITPVKIFDPNDEFDEEYFEFGLFMSRREYKTINRRLQRGRISSIKEGKYVGSVAPFGYDRVKLTSDKGYTLEVNSEGDIVKTIFNLYAYENLSLHEVARQLNKMGLKPRKSKQWSVNTVKDILNNPVYAGKIKWNSRKQVKVYKNDKIVKTRPRSEEYILVNGIHKALIDEKTWNITESKRKSNIKPIRHNSSIKNPLASLIICEKCGSKMIRRSYTSQDKEPTLFCGNPECDNIGSKLNLVEEKVLEGLKLWLKNYKLDYKNNIEKATHKKLKLFQESIKSLEEEIEKENNKLLTIYDFLEDGTYTKEVFRERSEKVTQNINDIKTKLESYKEKLDKEKIIDEERIKLTPKIENILDIYNLLETAEEKNNLLKTVLSEVLYLKTEKAIRKDSDPMNFTITLYPKISKIA